MKNLILFALIIFAYVNSVSAQILKPVKWSFASKKINEKEAVIYLKATIDKGWHLYSQDVPKGGPIATTINFKKANNYILKGKTLQPQAKSIYESVFKMKLEYFENEVIFQQRITLSGKAPIVKGTIEFMACDNNQCTPPDEINFAIPIR